MLEAFKSVVKSYKDNWVSHPKNIDVFSIDSFFKKHDDQIHKGFNFIYESFSNNSKLINLNYFEVINEEDSNDKQIEIHTNYMKMESGDFSEEYFDPDFYKTTSLLLNINKFTKNELKELLDFFNFSLSFLKTETIEKLSETEQLTLYSSNTIIPSQKAKIERNYITPVIKGFTVYFKEHFPELLDKKLVLGGTLRQAAERADNIYSSITGDDYLFMTLFLLFLKSVQDTKNPYEVSVDKKTKKISIHGGIKYLYPHFLEKKNGKFTPGDKKKFTDFIQKYSHKGLPYFKVNKNNPVMKSGQLFETEQSPVDNKSIKLTVNTEILLFETSNFIEIQRDEIIKSHALWKKKVSESKELKKSTVRESLSDLPIQFYLVLSHRIFDPKKVLKQGIEFTPDTLNKTLRNLSQTLLTILQKASLARTENANKFKQCRSQILNIIGEIAIERKWVESFQRNEKTGNYIFYPTNTFVNRNQNLKKNQKNIA